MRRVAGHFLTLRRATLRALSSRSLRAAILSDLRSVRVSRIVPRSSCREIRDGDCLPDTASVLSSGSFSRHNVRVAAGLCNVRFGGDECDSTGAIFTNWKNLERIQSGFGVAASVRVSSARSDRNRVALNSGIAKNGKCEATHRGPYRHEVTVRQTHPLGCGGIHFSDGLPANLRDRIRNLLQPRLVGAASVSDEWMRINDEVHVAARLLDRRSRVQCWKWSRRRRLSQRSGRHSARECCSESSRATRESAYQPAAVICSGITHSVGRILLGDGDQYVGSRAGVEYRIHRRLLQRDRSANRLSIAPLLKRVVIGKNQISELRGFVRITRETHFEWDLSHRLGEASCLRERECRICPTDHQQRHATCVHARCQSPQLGG